MISQYKNIDQINSATKSVSATRLDKSVTEFLSYSANNRFTQVDGISNQEGSSCVELHVYSGGVWQTGNHKIQLQTKIPTYVDKTSNRTITFPTEPIAINLYDEFNKLNSVGESGEEVFTLNVMQISQAGFLSYSARTLFTSPKDILVSAYGQFTLQYIAFPWPYATSPNQPRNFDGMQIGTMIKFFTEDQYSIISFDSIETITTKMNLVPNPAS